MRNKEMRRGWEEAGVEETGRRGDETRRDEEKEEEEEEKWRFRIFPDIAQDGPNTPQIRSKRVPRPLPGPVLGQKTSKPCQDCPETPPQWPQDTPRAAPGQPPRPQDSQKGTPQEAPRRPRRGSPNITAAAIQRYGCATLQHCHEGFSSAVADMHGSATALGLID